MEHIVEEDGRQTPTEHYVPADVGELLLRHAGSHPSYPRAKGRNLTRSRRDHAFLGTNSLSDTRLSPLDSLQIWSINILGELWIGSSHHVSGGPICLGGSFCSLYGPTTRHVKQTKTTRGKLVKEKG